MKRTIFVGNPGTGKSTLLNAIIGEPRFLSGVSFGQGLTTCLQWEELENGDFYGDTPGLADVKLRNKAALEITKALKCGEGDFKLVFVVTEEAGRVRPADGVTMKLVLDALPKDRYVPYGIIVNKLTTGITKKLQNDERAYTTLVACLNTGPEKPTAYIHLYAFMEELVDEENAVHQPTSALKMFLDLLPSVHLKPSEVKDVKSDEFDAVCQKLEKQLVTLQKDGDVLREKMQQVQQELVRQTEKIQQDAEELANARNIELQTLAEKMQKDHEERVRQTEKMQLDKQKVEMQSIREKMQQDHAELERLKKKIQQHKKERRNGQVVQVACSVVKLLVLPLLGIPPFFG